MLDFNKLFQRTKQFGGIRLALEYIRLGVLWIGIKELYRCAVNRQSFKQIYPAILKKIEPYLVERYSPVAHDSMQRVMGVHLEHKRNKIVWFCWLQGLDHAPPIVKACYNSLQRHLVQVCKGGSKLQGYEIKVIDNDNWNDYVELPDFIISKWEKGRIPVALFSDLLRLELLIKHGGTWIDSTVLCTGFNDNQNDKAKYLGADLFLFQYTRQGSVPVSISNWFITACSNNEVLIELRDMLYAYWKDYDCTLDYYIFHLFFSMLSKDNPKEILAMPYAQSLNSLVILHHLGDEFNQEKWDNLTQKVSFHKLAFRVSKEIKEDKENYFNKIISLYT